MIARYERSKPGTLALGGGSRTRPVGLGVEIRLASFVDANVGVMLMRLRQHRVVQTFALTAGFKVRLGLPVVKSGLRELLGGVVVMIGNLD